MEKELRKGNLITDKYWEDFKTIITVESIGEKGINLYASDDGRAWGLHSGIIEYNYEFEELCGIPLTEQWLIDFKIKCTDSKYHIEGFELDLNCFYRDGYVHVFDIRGCFIARVQHVHKFQNLIYELTGIELLTNKNQK